MDLSFKPEHAAFRQEVRDFLDEELTDELREAGKLTASVFSEVEYSSKWHKILYKKGLKLEDSLEQIDILKSETNDSYLEIFTESIKSSSRGILR